MNPDSELEVDACGTLCPEPVLQLGRAAKAHPTRPLTIRLLADDPTTVHDVPAWCRMRGATLLSHDVSADIHQFVVRIDK